MLTILFWWIVICIIASACHGLSKLGSVIASYEEPCTHKLEQWLGYDDRKDQ